MPVVPAVHRILAAVILCYVRSLRSVLRDDVWITRVVTLIKVVVGLLIFLLPLDALFSLFAGADVTRRRWRGQQAVMMTLRTGWRLAFAYLDIHILILHYTARRSDPTVGSAVLFCRYLLPVTLWHVRISATRIDAPSAVVRAARHVLPHAVDLPRLFTVPYLPPCLIPSLS